MKKQLIETLLVAILIGFVIRVSALVSQSLPVFSNLSDYLLSTLISLVSGYSLYFYHLKVLTRPTYSLKKKVFISLLIVSSIYVTSNLIMLGLDILFEIRFYVVGLMIQVVALPFIWYFHKKTNELNSYLVKKNQQ